MDSQKIVDLINAENNDRAYEIEKRARDIIRGIANEQSKIEDCNKRIEELRTELKAISHEPVNVAKIIG